MSGPEGPDIRYPTLPLVQDVDGTGRDGDGTTGRDGTGRDGRDGSREAVLLAYGPYCCYTGLRALLLIYWPYGPIIDIQALRALLLTYRPYGPCH